MSDSRRSTGSIIGWVILGIWFFGSLGGVFYSFRFLISAIFCLIAAACAWPRDKKRSDGWAALKMVRNWEESGRSPSNRPAESVFQEAAKWFMYNIDTIRKEDLNTWKGVDVPAGVRPYIKSERELKRQRGVIF